MATSQRILYKHIITRNYAALNKARGEVSFECPLRTSKCLILHNGRFFVIEVLPLAWEINVAERYHGAQEVL